MEYVWLYMKALLLAAGKGSRLRPLTNTIPKCLVKIGGKPIIQHWFEKLHEVGCRDFIINTHYLAPLVSEFVENYKKINSDIKIEVSFEKELLGTAGTFREHMHKLCGEINFVLHVDNYTPEGLDKLMHAHIKKQPECLLTMMTFSSSTPSECGVLLINEKNVMIDYKEKVKDPPSTVANSAIYIFDNAFVDWCNESKNACNASDISNDIIPLLLGRVQTWHSDKFFQDIGTYDGLMSARNHHSKFISK